MIYYEPNKFDESYGDFLNKIKYFSSTNKSKKVYVDPDSTFGACSTSFYNDLTDFLSSREKTTGKNEYSFMHPSKSPKAKYNTNSNLIDEYKIMVKKNEESIFRLTSDQFGFSAAEKTYYNSKYPLTRLLKSEKSNVKVSFIVEYVNKSRTIGGSFLWPISPNGSRYCGYNIRRGERGYLEDRVDLTLLEVKHAINTKYETDEYASDLLSKEYLKNKEMRIWLSHFKDFKEYISYFMLEPFIENEMPISIITGKALDEATVLKYKDIYRKTKIGQLQALDGSELCSIFKRLQGMIIQRSETMEIEIEQYRKSIKN